MATYTERYYLLPIRVKFDYIFCVTNGCKWWHYPYCIMLHIGLQMLTCELSNP